MRVHSSESSFPIVKEMLTQVEHVFRLINLDTAGTGSRIDAALIIRLWADVVESIEPELVFMSTSLRAPVAVLLKRHR